MSELQQAAALRAWLRAAADGDPVHAAAAAAEAVAADPWAVVAFAGALARAELRLADEDLGISARLQALPVGAPAAVATVPKGAPYPAPSRGRRRGAGAFDTPPALARRTVAAALAAARRPVQRALDPACGAGAFLVALAEAGVAGVRGIELDPATAAVAAVAAPTAEVEVGDGLAPPSGDPADLVVGNPPFVPPERQDKALRAALQARLPWLVGRFDLAVPFAELAVARAAPGAGVALLLPAPLLSQPYGRPLRRRWTERHQLHALASPLPFPGASVSVALVALTVGLGPAPLPDHGLPAAALLSLPNAPWCAWMEPGDPELLAAVEAASVPLGSLCEIDTGVVSHGAGGGKARLLHDHPGPGRVPYVDAKDLSQGQRRWLDYQPERMHRAKHPGLFLSPKILVQRLHSGPRFHAWLDLENTYAGHTLTVVRPRDLRVPAARLLELLRSPLTTALLRISSGDRLDVYPSDLARLCAPRAWLYDADLPLDAAWRLSSAQIARLEAISGLSRRSDPATPLLP